MNTAISAHTAVQGLLYLAFHINTQPIHQRLLELPSTSMILNKLAPITNPQNYELSESPHPVASFVYL